MRGSIRKKGGSYEVRVCIGRDADGRYKYLSRSARTKKEAEALLNRLVSELQEGRFVDPSKLTVGAFMDRWLETVKPSVRASTWESYEGLARVHIKPALGAMPLQALRPLHVQNLYAEKLAEGLSPRRVRYIHAVLHNALDQAVKWGMVARNVTEAATPPRQERREMQVLTPQEARAVLAAASGDRLEALWVMALSTGMRQGELLALRWSDVDFKAGAVTVNQAVEWVGGKPIISEPKTRTSRRTIPLPGVAVEALKRHRKRQAEERLAAGPEWQDNGLVFTTPTGGVLDRHALAKRAFPRLLCKAGVKPIRFHDLRHSAATFMLAQGLPIKIVQQVLGHATATMTLDRYGHVLPNAERAAASAMDALLRG